PIKSPGKRSASTAEPPPQRRQVRHNAGAPDVMTTHMWPWRDVCTTKFPVRHRTGFALLALGLGIGLAFVSCQDERSITAARRVPRLAASVQTATVVISPTADGFLNIDATNYGTSSVLSVYTWPDHKIANASVLKFDLASIPTGSTTSCESRILDLPQHEVTRH